VHILYDDGMTNKPLSDSTVYLYFYKYSSEHIELPAKLLGYFLQSDKSNINQSGTHVNESCTHAYMHSIHMYVFCMMMA